MTTSNVLVEEDTQEINVKWLTAVYQIHVNTAEPVEQKKEDLFALAQLSTGELSATRESPVIQTHAETEGNVFQLPKDLFADVPQGTAERRAQRKMNVNPTPVRTEAVVWLITLVEDLIVNVHWDSEEPRVWTKTLAGLIHVAMEDSVRKLVEALLAIAHWDSKERHV